MSTYKALLIWLNNLLSPSNERYIPPVVCYRYTFNMVGINRHITVTNTNRDDACRAAYDLLNENEIDNLEWAELISSEPIEKKESIMKSRLLTLQQLIDAYACVNQVELFQSTFGKEVKVTVALAKKHAQYFDFDFAARKFLSAPALAEYDKVTAPARAEYNKVATAARAEYNKVKAAAWATAYINDGK